MHRARALVPPDAIRIEDEVWQEAFREATRLRSRARPRSHDGARVAARPVRGNRAAAAIGTVASLEREPRAVEPTRQPIEPTRQPFDPRSNELAVDFGDPAATPGRRTVTITGRGAERNLPWTTDAGRRRPARLPHERAGFRPDRVAMWAVFLGALLVLVAAASAHA
jgi:hypothetical protein